MFDIVALLAEFRGCLTFVQGKFLKNPLLWPFITQSGFVTVKAGDPISAMDAFYVAKEKISRGELFAIFPEGTRSRSGKLGALKDGVFRIALETGIDITPIFFTMNRPFLTGGAMYTYDLGCVHLKGYMKPPIQVKNYSNNAEGLRQMSSEYRRQYEEFIATDLALDWNRLNSPFQKIVPGDLL
jgi:1-acyl-sn-glycerol-3-phosphate acyltransferase